MLDKTGRLLCCLLLIFTFTAMAQVPSEEKLSVMVKKSEVGALAEADKEIPMTLNGMRQAVTAELIKRNLNSEVFWSKVEEKKLSDKDEVQYFRPLFSALSLVIDTPPIETPADAKDLFLRGNFLYVLDANKTKILFDEVLSEFPDTSIKTFYIFPDIRIDSEMTWTDVGVTKKENFSGVIVDSWKKWAVTQFKNFPNIVILEKDFTTKPEQINPESVTLKWNSTLKKTEVFQDRKSARYELVAQYVLVNTKTNQSLVAFDFPMQKKEFVILNPKDLSSNLASQIYNLLNSQTAKITSALELNRASSTLSVVEIKINGKHGLFDITQINSFLGERFKDVMLTSELKSYSSDSSVISIKSTLTPDALYANFSKDGGKFPLNEQKLLLFSPDTRAFAIIPNSPNN